MSKEISKAQQQRRRGRARQRAEREMTQPESPMTGEDVARVVAQDKEALKQRAKAKSVFRRM